MPMISRFFRTDFGEYKYLSLFAMLNITFMLVSNFVAPRLVTLGGVSLSVSVYYFPVIYLIADILTEVYGYSKARKVMWLSIFCKISAALVVWFALAIPPSPQFVNEDAFQKVLSSGLRAAVASVVGIIIGDIGGSYILAKIKVASRGKHLWLRFVVSTFIGEALNTIFFYGIAFAGVMKFSTLAYAMIVACLVKTLWEIVALPLTYPIVRYLKKAENVDYYDRKTNFNPFILEA